MNSNEEIDSHLEVIAAFIHEQITKHVVEAVLNDIDVMTLGSMVGEGKVGIMDLDKMVGWAESVHTPYKSLENAVKDDLKAVAEHLYVHMADALRKEKAH